MTAPEMTDADSYGKTLHVSLNFDDLEFEQVTLPEPTLEETAVEAAMLRAGFDWVELAVTSRTQVCIWRGELTTIVLEDLQTALTKLRMSPPAYSEFYWREGTFCIWFTPSEHRVRVDIEQTLYERQPPKTHESRELSIDACILVWTRMAAQLARGLGLTSGQPAP